MPSINEKQDKTTDKSRQPGLVSSIISDWLEHKITIALLLFVLASAYAVIYYAWNNRQLNTELQRLLEDKDKLDIDWRHMLLENNVLSEHNRVEQIAKDKLNMQRPSGEQEIIIKTP
ncbi:cell division protein FtsL [Catenovulum sp. 2E275]|uniref:cell division protein FtsL n=1 Tax=Catenovulum sp. 2E275 TaxID=2980497 RepID=UPI0021CFC7CF|nr:cell division protein FtsL [Catenovulum sp. 2E275]MCU4674219.1 cell division protein FtsL [Catenovulum sp. 2E275]